MQWADSFRRRAGLPGRRLRRRVPESARLHRLGAGLHRRDLGRLGRQGDEGRPRRGRLARRSAVGRQGPDRGDGLVVGGLRDDVARRKRQPLQGARLDDGRLRPPVDVLDDGGALVPRVGPEGGPLAEPLGVRETEPVVVRREVQDADARDHRPEGLPRPLHAVPRVLHRPPEDGRPVAPDRPRELGPTGPAGTTWSSTTPPTSTGSTSTSAARRLPTTRRPSWQTTSSGRRRGTKRKRRTRRSRPRPPCPHRLEGERGRAFCRRRAPRAPRPVAALSVKRDNGQDEVPADLDAEVAKFFRGTPDERVARALRLGRRGVDVFLASALPPGTPRSVAAEMLSARTRSTRRPSATVGAPSE